MPSDPSSATKASLDASARYIEEKKVYELFEGLMADLLIKKPNDPIAHMIASLKQPPRPRVFVFGPPGADTQSQCELISSKLELPVATLLPLMLSSTDPCCTVGRLESTTIATSFRFTLFRGTYRLTTMLSGRESMRTL